MNAALIGANVASIEAVPVCVWDGMLYGQHNRTFALLWAARGYDVYAHQSDAGVWTLWLGNQRIELGRDPAAASAEGGE